MSQQCPACHIALTPTAAGSFVLRCRRCGRRYAARPTPTTHAPRRSTDADGSADVFGFDLGFGSTPDASPGSAQPDLGPDSGHGTDFGGGGGFDGGGSSGDF